jgi:hypothetical protein
MRALLLVAAVGPPEAGDRQPELLLQELTGRLSRTAVTGQQIQGYSGPPSKSCFYCRAIRAIRPGGRRGVRSGMQILRRSLPGPVYWPRLHLARCRRPGGLSPASLAAHEPSND